MRAFPKYDPSNIFYYNEDHNRKHGYGTATGVGHGFGSTDGNGYGRGVGNYPTHLIQYWK